MTESRNPDLTLQAGLVEWATHAFGRQTVDDQRQRAMRCLEEAVELAQALGLDEAACHRQVSHTYGRPVGEPSQEVAGVINGASELLGRIFGDAGVHARSAVGVAVLPLDAPVEVELVAEFR